MLRPGFGMTFSPFSITPRAQQAFALLSLAATAIASASCGDPRASFTTKVASDFPPANHTVSVFGVFKDGRMSTEAWDELGAKLSAAFASGACQAEYREDLITTNAPLSSAIDDYVRANGISDDLLDTIAPAATGDAIVVFTMAGKLAATPVENGTGAMPPTTPTTTMRGSTGFRGQHGAMAGGMRPFRSSPDALEISASLFSVSQHRSVAVVALRYTGDSVADALAQLATRLRASLPGSACGAWNANVRVDDQRIRELAER